MLKDRFDLFANWLMNKSPIILRVIFVCALGALILTGLYLIAMGIETFVDYFNYKRAVTPHFIGLIIGGAILVGLPIKILWKSDVIQNRKGSYKFLLGIILIILGGGGLFMSACGAFFVSTFVALGVDYDPLIMLFLVIGLPSLIAGVFFIFILYKLIKKGGFKYEVQRYF